MEKVYVKSNKKQAEKDLYKYGGGAYRIGNEIILLGNFKLAHIYNGEEYGYTRKHND